MNEGNHTVEMWSGNETNSIQLGNKSVVTGFIKKKSFKSE
jgi:hypothetical protein